MKYTYRCSWCHTTHTVDYDGPGRAPFTRCTCITCPARSTLESIPEDADPRPVTPWDAAARSYRLQPRGIINRRTA